MKYFLLIKTYLRQLDFTIVFDKEQSIIILLYNFV